MTKARALILLFVAAAVAGGLGWSYLAQRGEQSAEAEREAPVNAPQRIREVGGETVVTLAPDVQKQGGIETAELPQVAVAPLVTGYGIVLDLRPLTDLANRIAVAKADRGAAAAKLAASRAAYERAQGLYQNRQNISAAQLQAAEASFGADQAAMAAADSRLSTLGTAAVQEWGPVLGKTVANGGPLLGRLLDREEVLVQVTLPPDRAVAAAPPKATGAASEGASAIRLTLVSPATRTDPHIQGQSFFYTAPGSSGLLPGASLVVHLPAGPQTKGVATPASAVVWRDGRAWIYLREGPDTFVRRGISTAVPEAGGGYFVAGLPQPAVVVVKGAQALLSEEMRAEIRVGD